MGANVSVPMYRRLLPQRLRMEATVCDRCGEVSFPPRGRCRNQCSPAGMTTTVLSGLGRIHALTEVEPAAAPPEFASQVAGGKSYHVAIVALDEGPLITAQIVDTASERAPRIGDRVSATTRMLYKDDGIRRYGFKFAVTDETEAIER